MSEQTPSGNNPAKSAESPDNVPEQDDTLDPDIRATMTPRQLDYVDRMVEAERDRISADPHLLGLMYQTHQVGR